VGLIGPNGSGKTTLFNLISGLYRPESGSIKYKGREITGLGSYKICQLGIARTFQIPRPFANLTVLENVIVGVLFGKHGSKRINLEKAEQRAIEILRFIDLIDKANEPAENLTLTELKRLELARALATEPQLLLLDEIMAGLNPAEIADALDLIKKINNQGITIFMIEHLMRAVAAICNRVIVLNYGEKIAEGTMEEVANNEKVVKAYLGEKWKL
jgi:branched-chain amino acid transport system ATP-binding protein